MSAQRFPGIRQGLIASVLFVSACSALAQASTEAAPLAEDPVVEQRLIVISEELRCLVCQNESLAGSRADLALDLRREIRDLIKAGKTDDQIREFMVERYGDFVLYRPPVKATTVALWAGPFVFLGLGLIGLLVYLRQRSRSNPEQSQALTSEEIARAEALLKGDQK
jgi:cytochrome c-type biogenesis protein CcmH